MKENLVLHILIVILSFSPYLVKAQKTAVKTNFIYDMTATINFGGEYGFKNEKWSVDLSGNYNNWNMAHGKRWKHWFFQPELRYWFCENLGGHFLGLHVQSGKYNIGGLKNGISFLGTDFSKLSDGRYQGWFAGAGIGYGYAWMLSKHWNLEAEIGVGYNYTKSDHYPCADCGDKLEEGKEHHYFGPTKTALNLVYIF